MIKIVSFFAIASCFFAEAQQVGSDSYGEQTIESLEVCGTVKLNGTTILDRLKITGNLITLKASLPSVNAVGDVQLSETKIKEQMNVIGSLRASQSIFEKQLSFLGQRATFSKCTLCDIAVERDLAFKGKQIIELKDKTFVDGSIEFQKGNGEVWVYPGSRISGAITGGKIVRKQ